MINVRPKKYLGQHFLKDRRIAARIVDSLVFHDGYQHVIEVGPGTGILTDLLFDRFPEQTTVVDIDPESVIYLTEKYPGKKDRIIEADFLNCEPEILFPGPSGIIGNFPYNISSQIFFKVFDNRDRIREVVGMVQKEVGIRIASGPGSKNYGILSVFLSAFYDIELLFTVKPGSFFPPPKVMSSVIRLKRNSVKHLDCDIINFKKVVKQGFQNRRKTLRNALKPLHLPGDVLDLKILNLRAEQLSVEDFVGLTREIDTSAG